ncbi:MAG: RNA polymerase sigma-70 factor [Prolixibacteraceae bacterium]
MGRNYFFKDSTDFKALFEKFYPELCRYAFYLTNDKSIAEDLVQELFISLWEKRDSLQIESVKSYLYTAVKNRSLNFLQSYYKKNIQFGITGKDDSVSNSTKEEVEYNELTLLLKEAVKTLPPKCYSVFFLKRFEYLSTKEIAGKLHLSEKTVENQMTIALKKIAVFLDRYWK